MYAQSSSVAVVLPTHEYVFAAGGKSALLAMWGVDAAPYMHAMLLGWPIGATVGPLVAGLFVSSSNSTSQNTTSYTLQTYCDDVKCYDRATVFHDTAVWRPFEPTERDDVNSNEVYIDDDRFPDDSSIQYAFYIAACFTMTSAVLFFIFFVYQRKSNATGDRVRKSMYGWKEIFSPSKWTEGQPRLGVDFLACMVVFFLALDSCNNVVGFYLPTYAVDSDLGFSRQEAATLSSVSSLSGSVSRIISIILSNYVAVHYLFSGYVSTALLSVLLLGVFGTRSKTSLVVFTALFGFFWRPVRGHVYSYMNLYMIMIAAIFGFEGFVVALLSMPLTALHGYMYDHTFIEVIFYLGVLYSFVFFVVHIVFLLLGRFYGTLLDRRQSRKDTEKAGFEVSVICDSVDLEMDDDLSMLIDQYSSDPHANPL